MHNVSVDLRETLSSRSIMFIIIFIICSIRDKKFDINVLHSWITKSLLEYNLPLGASPLDDDSEFCHWSFGAPISHSHRLKIQDPLLHNSCVKLPEHLGTSRLPKNVYLLDFSQALPIYKFEKNYRIYYIIIQYNIIFFSNFVLRWGVPMRFHKRLYHNDTKYFNKLKLHKKVLIKSQKSFRLLKIP